MGPLEIQQALADGSISRLSQGQATAMRAEVMHNHRDALTNLRHVHHDLFSKVVVELAKAAHGEGAELGSDGETTRTSDA